MARRMKDPVFLEHQKLHRLDPHIAPINEFVASLQNQDDQRWVPEVAPIHGGVDAVVLTLLRDPGPKTQEDRGSGFLCIENDDPTAERQCELFDQYGISPRSVLPWNAYPWYINRAPRAVERDAGAVVLGELIDLMPRLRVVLLQGNDASDVWQRLLKRRPILGDDRAIEAIESIHPGRQALWTSDPAERQARLDKQKSAFEHVARILTTG
jgi:hypothetical protein